MQRHILQSILLITAFVSSLCQQGRIYGGYQADITKAPYMAQVMVVHEKPVPGVPLESLQCGGSILKTNLIITAGHCIKNFTTGEEYGPDRYYIFVGSNIYQLGEMHTVKKVNLHPKYKGGGDNHFFHDMGILELNDHITLDHTKQLVTLAEKNDKPKTGDDVFVSGWGKNPDHKNDRRLYQVYLKVISSKKCHDQIAGGSVKEIAEHQICARAENKSDCQGDSGGPLIHSITNRQIGVVSYGAEDCTSNKPSVFTRITDNLDFIESVMDAAEPMSDATCKE